MKELPPTTPGIRGILLDIEGTITPISFVHDVLFPYARAQTYDFLAANWNSVEVGSDLDRLREQHAADAEQGQAPPPLVKEPREAQLESFTGYIHWLIDQDRKSTGLKSLQGKIWKQGYLDGTLRAPLFTDVVPALNRWERAGLKIAIFSSGSVLAQQLLFAHTAAGDVTRLINAYFDTTSGSKTASDSYRAIASAIPLPPREVLFISDVVKELDAAETAGMQTLLCMRPGNPPQPSAGRHRIVRSLDGVPTSEC